MQSGISLVIATYNRGERIADTLESVFMQRGGVDEVIVVDDGSSDSTVKFVSKSFPSVRIISKKNGGTSSARNVGAANAKFARLVFLDHDDLLHQGATEVLSRLLDEYPNTSAAFCDHAYLDLTTGTGYANHHFMQPSFTRLRDIPSEPIEAGKPRVFGKPMYSALLQGNLLQQPFMIRKDVFDRIGGYRESVRYCEDWDLYVRLTRRFQVVLSDSVISTHRVEGTNLHLTDWQRQYGMYLNVLSHQLEDRYNAHPRDVRVIKRRIGSMHKDLGDAARSVGDYRTAWRRYLKSFLSWPFDHVVAARLALWHPAAQSLANIMRPRRQPR